MSRTILLADDSVTIQKVVELTFMEEEVDVLAVGSGAEAVQKLEESSPDLVIADVHMPGPDGFEICRRVKKEHPGTPVLLLVGTFEPFNQDDVKACGADGFLKKPFDSQELMRQVESLLKAAPEPVAAEIGVSNTESDELFATSLSGDDLLAGVDAEIDDLAGAVAEPPPSAKPTAAPSGHPTEERAAPPAGPLSDEEIDRIARRVVELIGDKAVRDVAWEVVPDLAEVVIKDRLRELESQID